MRFQERNQKVIDAIIAGNFEQFKKSLNSSDKSFPNRVIDNDGRNLLQLIALYSRKNQDGNTKQAYRQMFKHAIDALGKKNVREQLEYQEGNTYGNTVLHYLLMQNFLTKGERYQILKPIDPELYFLAYGEVDTGTKNRHFERENNYYKMPAFGLLEKELQKLEKTEQKKQKLLKRKEENNRDTTTKKKSSLINPRPVRENNLPDSKEEEELSIKRQFCETEIVFDVSPVKKEEDNFELELIVQKNETTDKKNKIVEKNNEKTTFVGTINLDMGETNFFPSEEEVHSSRNTNPLLEESKEDINLSVEKKPQPKEEVIKPSYHAINGQNQKEYEKWFELLQQKDGAEQVQTKLDNKIKKYWEQGKGENNNATRANIAFNQAKTEIATSLKQCVSEHLIYKGDLAETAKSLKQFFNTQVAFVDLSNEHLKNLKRILDQESHSPENVKEMFNYLTQLGILEKPVENGDILTIKLDFAALKKHFFRKTKDSDVKDAFQNIIRQYTASKTLKTILPKENYSPEDAKNIFDCLTQLGILDTFPVIIKDKEYTIPVDSSALEKYFSFTKDNSKTEFQKNINLAAQKIESLFHAHITGKLGLPKDRARAIASKDNNVLNKAFALDDIAKAVSELDSLKLLFGSSKAEFATPNGMNFNNLHPMKIYTKNPIESRPFRITNVSKGIDVTGAPWDEKGFYQEAVNKRKPDVIVSLTTPHDNITRGVDVDQHHLAKDGSVQLSSNNEEIKCTDLDTTDQKCTKRTLHKIVDKHEDPHPIYHYHYDQWKDGDQAGCAADILKIINHIIEQHPDKKPNISVHCRDGKNRSRNFAAAWELVSQIVYGKEIVDRSVLTANVLKEKLDIIDKNFGNAIGGCNPENHEEFRQQFANSLARELNKRIDPLPFVKNIEEKNTPDSIKCRIEKSFLEKLQEKYTGKLAKDGNYKLSEGLKKDIHKAFTNNFYVTKLKGSAEQQNKLVDGFVNALFKSVKKRTVATEGEKTIRVRDVKQIDVNKQHEISGNFGKYTFKHQLEKELKSIQQQERNR